MNIVLNGSAASQTETELLVLPVVDKSETKEPQPEVLGADAPLAELAARLIADQEITGKSHECTLLLQPQGVAARRVLFIGAGKAAEFGPEALRRWAGVAVRTAKSKLIKKIAFVLPDASAATVRAASHGAVYATFDADSYNTTRKDRSIDELILLGAAGQEASVEEGRILGESENFARELVNEPGNHMTPAILADRARQMASATGLGIEVSGPAQIQAMKMGAFWSVAQGSAEEPRLIVLRHEPEGAAADVTLGLVGKGLTFDSGGISLKPGANMEEMKTDMAGAATMLGAMRAIALLNPKVRVLAVLCATENMPDGKAQKPGDVQTAMNGKTIEIINTDAEGRLVLADGLCYARQLGATHLIDAATLTGACVVALGHLQTGVFTNNAGYWQSFEKAVQASGEKMWRLPMDEEYHKLIDSDIADIKNSGGRWGGAISAAIFLQEFVDKEPWLHLDIAGTAWFDESKPWAGKGPSGVAIRSIVAFARQLAEKA
jgi:leucyl aminopeptidase